jgi:hypothetical protein
MASNLALAVLLLVASCASAASAAKYTVGDTSGWTTGADYTTWASDKKFKVGDSLGQYLYLATCTFPGSLSLSSLSNAVAS